MHAKQEHWNYGRDVSIWVGKYRNSHNIPHWHYACELLEVERGELEVFCNSERYTLRPGNAFFINSENVHCMHAVTPDTVTRLFVFNYDMIKDFANGIDLACPLVAREYRLPELYDELMNILVGGAEFCGKEAQCKLTMTLIDIFRHEPTVPKTDKQKSYSRFKRLLADIDVNYEFYDLDRAAEFAAMNPAYLSRLFHKLMGMTFSQYLNIVRCEKAVELLQNNSDVSITQVAAGCGFSTIRNFNRIFKQLTGYTPRTLPPDYIMKEHFSDRADANAVPTLAESILLESSDQPEVG